MMMILLLGIIVFFLVQFSKKKNGTCRHRSSGHSPSENTAFEAYRSETLKRMEDEQAAFRGFMENLRAAKDKAEFDQFMDKQEARGFDEVPPAPKSNADFGTTPKPA